MNKFLQLVEKSRPNQNKKFNRVKFYKRYFEQLAPKGVTVTTDKETVIIKLK